MADEFTMIKIGALWDKPNSMQGKLGDARLVVLKNKKKTKDNQPDHIVYVDKPQKREEDTGQGEMGVDPNEEIPF